MSAGYYVCASAGPLRIALDGACVASVDAVDAVDGDVPSLRLAAHLGVEEGPEPDDANARRVAVEHAMQRVHLLVSESVRVRTFAPDAEQALPTWIAALDHLVGVKGVLLEDLDLLLVLDPAVLVRAALTRE